LAKPKTKKKTPKPEIKETTPTKETTLVEPIIDFLKTTINDNKKIKLLSKILTLISNLVGKELLQLQYNDEEFIIKGLNTNQSAFIVLTLQRNFFDEVEINDDAEPDNIIGLNGEHIQRFVNYCTKATSLQFTVNSSDFRVNSESEFFSKEFTCLLEAFTGIPPLVQPDMLALSTSITMATKAFKELCKNINAKMFVMQIKKKEITFLGKNTDDHTTSKLTIKQEKTTDETNETDKPIDKLTIVGETDYQVKFSLDNIGMVVEIIQKIDTIILETEQKKPMRMQIIFSNDCKLDALFSPVEEKEID
jgi:hypothetical protein